MRTGMRLFALNMALLLTAVLLSGVALAFSAELQVGVPLEYTETSEVSTFTFTAPETGWYTFTIRAVASCGNLSLYENGVRLEGMVYTRNIEEANENLTIHLTGGVTYTLNHTPKVKNMPQYTVEANRVAFSALRTGASTAFETGSHDYSFFRFTPSAAGWYTISTPCTGSMFRLEGDESPASTGYIGLCDYYPAGEAASFAFVSEEAGAFDMSVKPSSPSQLTESAPLTLATARGAVTYVRFIPQETAKYTFTAESASSVGVRGIRIRDGEGQLLAGGAAGTGFATVFQTAELTAGVTYYVGVTGGEKSSCVVSVSRGDTRRSYTVTFESGGGTPVEQQTVREGESALEPESPTKSGWLFSGWYYAGSDTLYDFSQAVSGSLTLTAHWEPMPEALLVSFRSEGGTPVDSQTVAYGELAAEPEPPTRDGYEFSGWLWQGEAFSFDTPVTEDLVLTASWTAKRSFTVTFDPAGGEPVPSQTVLSGGTAREETSRRSGYRFSGWYLEDKKYDFTTPVMRDITLTARWTSLTGLYVSLGLGAAALGGGTSLLILRSKKRRDSEK